MPRIVFEWSESGTMQDRDVAPSMCRVVENDQGTLLAEKAHRNDAMNNPIWESVLGSEAARMISHAVWQVTKRMQQYTTGVYR